MAALYADENVRRPLVLALRTLGHDVLTAFEDGRANQRIPDDQVLARATALNRAVITNNRRDYHKLHRRHAGHGGIVTYTVDPDMSALAQRIHAELTRLSTLTGVLVKIIRPGRAP